MASAPAAAGMVPVDRCQLCGGTERAVMFAEPPFTVVRCACGLVYVTPRLPPDQLAAVYGEGYWKSDNPKDRGYADYENDGPLYRRTFERRWRLVAPFAPPGARVLDLGCAAGYFLAVARDHGCQVAGVEMSTPIAQKAKTLLGADCVHNGSLAEAVEALRLQPGSFDLITLWDVVEHIPEPQPVLRQLRPLLKPGGKLLLETQNVASRWARLLGPRWHHYKHAEHLYHFTPATLARLLADCGFRVRQCGAAYAGKYVSFGFISERAHRMGALVGLLFAPLRLLRGCAVYVNPRDEIIVVAEPA